MNDDGSVSVELRCDIHNRLMAFGKKGILPASAPVFLWTDLDNNVHGGYVG